MSENQAQIDYWNDRAGRNWARYQDALDRTLGVVDPLVLGRAAPQPGERVLDVGCGCGAMTLQLATRVGTQGHVAGVDISAGMLGRARERIVGAPGAPIVLIEADAASAKLPPVDLTFSRFGVMFFVDPVRAFTNLRAGSGRLAFVCWRTVVENDWVRVVGDAVAPYVAAEDPPAPDSPGPFSFGDPKRVRGILERAGWRDIMIDPADVRMLWGSDLADAIDLFSHIGPASRRLLEVEAPQRARGLGALGEALAPHLGPTGVSLGGAVWLVTARA